MQGSYHNTTHVRENSDIDVVVLNKDIFIDNTLFGLRGNLQDLNSYKSFLYYKLHGSQNFYFTVGNKTIKYSGNSNYVPADIIPCGCYRDATVGAQTGTILYDNKKSLPVKFRQFIGTKLLFSILINLPFVFASIIIFVSIISCSFDQIVIMILTSIIFVLLSSMIGILANLKWPKLEWNNEVVAVKQGLSVFVTLILNLILVVITLIPYILFFFEINSVLAFTTYFLISLSFYLIILTICTIILIKKEKKYTIK